MANKGTEIQIGDGSLHVGDRVVYPNQGICRITGVEVKQIAGRDWEVVTLSREEDGATVMVPRAKVMGIGLRKVASVDAIDDMFDQLAAPGDDPQLDWKVRHRENADRMTGGGLQGTLDVLKGLHALSRVRPLPQKERELYDSARHLLVGEIAAAMNLPLHVAEDNLDYALWPPPGMKRKGKPLQPATLAAPGSSVGVARPAARAGDDDLDDDLDLGDEADVEGDGGSKAAKAADEEESEVADETDTKDLVRQRAMRVTAEEEEPEDLAELAADALEATHEVEALHPTAKVRAPPGTAAAERPQRAAAPAPAPKAPPAAPGESHAASGSGLARSIAAKALETAANVLTPPKPPAKAAPRPAQAKTKASPAKKQAKPAAKAKPPAAHKPAAKKPAAKHAAKKPAKKPAGKGKR
jgi:CarD family transcriptional regulator